MILLGILPDTLTFAFWLHAKLITQFGTPSQASRTRSPNLNQERHTPMQVLIFGAPWCASCKVLKKQLEGQTFSGFEITHVDMDAQPEIAVQYGIKSLPSIAIPETGLVRRNVTTLKQFNDLLGSV